MIKPRARAARPKRSKKIPTHKGKSGLTPTFSDRPIGYGNPPIETQIKPGEVRNPGGRPKLLGESYKQMLSTVNERDPLGRTNAELLAESAKVEGLKGNIAALREIRSATEGDTINLATWQTELVAALKDGRLKADEVVKELGLDDARPILIAAGQAIPASEPVSADASPPAGDVADPPTAPSGTG